MDHCIGKLFNGTTLQIPHASSFVFRVIFVGILFFCVIHSIAIRTIKKCRDIDNSLLVQPSVPRVLVSLLSIFVLNNLRLCLSFEPILSGVTRFGGIGALCKIFGMIRTTAWIIYRNIMPKIWERKQALTNVLLTSVSIFKADIFKSAS